MIDIPEAGTLSPEDLSSADVEEVLNPGSTGVPELSPAMALPELVRKLESEIDAAEGEERLVRTAALAAALALSDPERALGMAGEVVNEAVASGSLLGEAEALRAIRTVPFFFRGESEDEDLAQLTRALELYAHLGMDVQKAFIMLTRAQREFYLDGSPRECIKTLWQARSLALAGNAAESLRNECLGAIAGLLGQMAWMSDRNADLARRYAAISVLHARKSDKPSLVAVQQLQVGKLASVEGDLASARRHLQRTAVIHQHHHEWWLAGLAIYWLGSIQLDHDDVEGARRSCHRLLRLMKENSIPSGMTGPAVAIMEGMLASRDGNLDRAVELLEPTLSVDPVTPDTRLRISQELSRAYEALGKPERAIAMLRRALDIQTEMHNSRIEANTAGFALSDEIAKLRAEHGEMSARAERDAGLLRAILPPSAYDEFRATGACEARFYDHVAIFYSDFAEFTQIASGMPPQQLMQILGELFTAFDTAMSRHACERVETIGDAYLAIAGLGTTSADPGAAGQHGGRATPVEVAIARAALEVNRHLETRNAEFRALGSPEFVARIGIQSGSIVGGLVGSGRIRFAVIGDAVNTAQRLESGGRPGCITVSERVAEVLSGSPEFELQKREAISAKGKGPLPAWEVSLARSV